MLKLRLVYIFSTVAITGLFGMACATTAHPPAQLGPTVVATPAPEADGPTEPVSAYLTPRHLQHLQICASRDEDALSTRRSLGLDLGVTPRGEINQLSVVTGSVQAPVLIDCVHRALNWIPLKSSTGGFQQIRLILRTDSRDRLVVTIENRDRGRDAGSVTERAVAGEHVLPPSLTRDLAPAAAGAR